METKAAATLQKKKVNKAKLKKTIKNVLCRPDPIYWPVVTDEQKDVLESILCKYKVPIPEFQKPLWKDIKSIPKKKRPKPPRVEKVEGLLFGITEVSNSIISGQCSGIVIEATVNPRTIIQPLLESCIDRRIPAVCFEGLRKTTKINFGIPTSCLGVKKECLTDLSKVIQELGSSRLPEKKIEALKVEDVEMTENKKNLCPFVPQESKTFEYLYRTDKKSRVFVPPSEEKQKKEDKKFKGQDFIEFSDISEQKKPFMKMMVKRISNNPNRVKVKVK